jgi:hypothetical protein
MKSFRSGFSNLRPVKVFFVVIVSFFITSCAKNPTVSTSEVINIKSSPAG